MNRAQRIYQIGCIACIRMGLYHEPCQVHHLLLDGKAGQKRLGDDSTIGLCPWHHVGEPAPMSYDTAMILKGPSYKLHSRKFRAMFGADTYLLGLQDKYIAQAELLNIKPNTRIFQR